MLISPAAVPSGSFQSKDQSRLASRRCNILAASGSPGQIRRPAPKGISSMWHPLKSTSPHPPPEKRSGRKTSASEPHVAGSLPMAHALIRTVVSAGTV
ncbi:unnamed protein product [Spirodela intermedia]|uniref:Uncharacterized protein n=1 Tax=Spirodela intermedia TaxID=51605 RepID=A0A7I8KC71_SPIIN|nr:unnamed protein product [Spirodela intermedia]